MATHKYVGVLGSALRRAKHGGVLSRLARLGARKFCGWVQLLALLGLFLEPLPRLSALWVPEGTGAPYWLPVSGEATGADTPPDHHR